MLIDLPEERGGAYLDIKWGKERNCNFPLFSFLNPLPLSQMCILYGIMWLGKQKTIKLIREKMC